MTVGIMMDSDDLIKWYEMELNSLKDAGTLTTDDLNPDIPIEKKIIKLINDFNSDNKSRINQLTLILDKLKQSDGDNDVK